MTSFSANNVSDCSMGFSDKYTLTKLYIALDFPIIYLSLNQMRSSRSITYLRLKNMENCNTSSPAEAELCTNVTFIYAC